MQHLSKEYKNAYLQVDEIICNQLSSINIEIPQTFNFTRGAFIAIQKEFSSKDIPSEDSWRWSQVKGRKTIWLPRSGYFVEFFKLMPRPISKCAELNGPLRKIWRFNVFDRKGGVLIFIILWCEKGEKSLLCIEDYKFLAPFIDPIIANSLWPSTVSVITECNLKFK